MSPPAAGLSLHEDERYDEDPDADHDEAVREIEGRPVAEVEEVGDQAQPDAVGEVRDAAADDEAERDGQHRMAGAGAREVGKHPGDRDRGDHDDGRRCVREETEGDAGVLDMADREGAQNVEPLTQPEVGRDHVLRHLVRDARRDRDRPERQPLHGRRRERAGRAGKRRQRVRRRAHSHLQLPQRLVHPSALRLQSMQREAHGAASSRSRGISQAQLVQVP